MGAGAGRRLRVGTSDRLTTAEALDATAVEVFDLAATPLRELNQRLHALGTSARPRRWRVLNPNGAHAVACGVDSEVEIDIEGHVGYYCGGMNAHATVRVHGNAGPGLAENMMSGTIVVDGNASQSAGATGHGGLLVVHGDAAARCGISMKGIDMVVAGSVGHMSAFMAQKGRLVVCGDAGEALGDSIYEARIYVRGEVEALGADCIEKELGDEHRAEIRDLLDRAGVSGVDASAFRRYGSARRLYNFDVDKAGDY
jgi:methylamine---glutamate N-methyltransferase subunit B